MAKILEQTEAFQQINLVGATAKPEAKLLFLGLHQVATGLAMVAERLGPTTKRPAEEPETKTVLENVQTELRKGFDRVGDTLGKIGALVKEKIDAD